FAPWISRRATVAREHAAPGVSRNRTQRPDGDKGLCRHRSDLIRWPLATRARVCALKLPESSSCASLSEHPRNTGRTQPGRNAPLYLELKMLQERTECHDWQVAQGRRQPGMPKEEWRKTANRFGVFHWGAVCSSGARPSRQNREQ